MLNTEDKQQMMDLYVLMKPEGSGPRAMMRIIRTLIEGIAKRDGYLDDIIQFDKSVRYHV